ncbi:MAG: hypothetical protein ACQETO_12065 [Pseudomonadota bacterium]
MRDYRIVWSGPDSILDKSAPVSAAAMALLSHLAASGHEVTVVGATVSSRDTPSVTLKQILEKISEVEGNAVSLRAGDIQHQLVRTHSTLRKAMTNREQTLWFANYTKVLSKVRPDLVMLHGDRVPERLAVREAGLRGIPTAALLDVGTETTLPVNAALHIPAESLEQILGILEPLLSMRSGDQDQQRTLRDSHLLLGHAN